MQYERKNSLIAVYAQYGLHLPQWLNKAIAGDSILQTIMCFSKIELLHTQVGAYLEEATQEFKKKNGLHSPDFVSMDYAI